MGVIERHRSRRRRRLYAGEEAAGRLLDVPAGTRKTTTGGNAGRVV